MSVDIKIYELSDGDNKYTFKLPTGNSLVTGIDRLAQVISKSLLTTPGSDQWAKQWGGGLDNLVPIMHDLEEVTASASNKIMFAISKVEQDIINSQLGQDLPDDEVLLSLEVLDIRVDNFDKVSLYIRIVTVGNVATDFTFEV
jgi:hypothetical protein